MTTKLIVITDAHANLPALTAVLDAARREGYDRIVHTGDAIGIGPFPAEVLDRLLNTPNLECIMGNHDAWFVDGLPQPQPPWMSDGEVRHQ
jgi:predicted phosphodiesterase